MIVDFRRKKSSRPTPLVIDGRTVEIVQHLKFLGSTISSNLKWELNVVNIIKKAQQRLYFLKRLRSFGLTTQTMLNFEIVYQQRLLGRATLISQDPSHPAHDLFEPLPSCRRFRSIKTRTNRFSTSFPPLAVQALSKQK